ncbi:MULTISPECIES: GDYXXLXY domain-containing protein [Sporosarcina]
MNTGKTITLETVPVDPRDILYGDYVSLQFAIEEFSKERLDPALIKEFSKHDTGKLTVYAVLEQDEGNLYGLKTVTHKKPSDGLFLKGDMYYYGEHSIDENQMYFANFLPDRFYVAENTGMQLEDLSRKGQLLADIKVRDGFAVLEDVRPK